MSEWILSVLRSGSYPGLVALAALECVFPPLPSELIFPLAGYLAQQGDLGLVASIVAGTVGSTVGAIPLYMLGHRLGQERLERFVEQRCRWTAVSVSEVRRAGDWFERHGGAAVLLGHFVPGLRSLISIPAGIRHMPMWRFLLYTALGSAAWIAALVGLGYVLGAQFTDVERWLDPVTWLVVGGALAWYLWRVGRGGTREECE